jgi:DMSO/TMAO reductase YedYZ molybdopterin-dependent catalytic subunit
MSNHSLPPGQRSIPYFPRFGLTPYANRFPKSLDRIEIDVGGDLKNPQTFSLKENQLAPITQTSDFHCVTTWSAVNLKWTGFRFKDFYLRLVAIAEPERNANFVIFKGQDGYSVSLPLEDLLADDVLLAHSLDDKPLDIRHGAPLRLIAPSHYGYKNPKHIKAIEFWRDDRNYRPPGLKIMDHPRARVQFEERGRGISGKILRYIYRPLISSTVRKFEEMAQKYERNL